MVTNYSNNEDIRKVNISNRRSGIALCGHSLGENKMGGHTLVELFVATTIGLLLISAVAGTFVWSNRNYKQDNSTALMQDNARHALEMISKDLLMAGFLHEVFNKSAVMMHDNLTVGGDCGTWAVDLSQMVTVTSKANKEDVIGHHACIDDNHLYMVGGTGAEFTDALGVKRAKKQTGAPVNGKLYLQTTLSGLARMVIYEDGVPKKYLGDEDSADTNFASATNWEFITSIYYVRKPDPPDDPDAARPKFSPPLLYRKTLQLGGGVPKIDTEDGGVAEGVEYFHLMWGIDHEMIDDISTTPPDGHPNYFVSSPTGAEMAGVVAANIYVLVRGRNFDRTYTDNKQYSLGDVTLPPTGTYNDNFRRKVFSTSVRLRNQVIQNKALSLISS